MPFLFHTAVIIRWLSTALSSSMVQLIIMKLPAYTKVVDGIMERIGDGTASMKQSSLVIIRHYN